MEQDTETNGAGAVRSSDWLADDGFTRNEWTPTPLKKVLAERIAILRKRADALQVLHDSIPEIKGETGFYIGEELRKL